MAAGKIHWNIDGTTLHLSGATNMPAAWTGYKGTFVQANNAAGYVDLSTSWRDPNAYTPTLTQTELDNLLGTITSVDFANTVDPYSCYKWFEGFNLDSITITNSTTNGIANNNGGSPANNRIRNTSRMFYNAFKGSGKTLTLSFKPNANNIDSSEMFANNPGLESVTITAGTYSAATTIAGMFKDCPNLKTVSLATPTFASVTDVTDIFVGCDSIETISMEDATFAALENGGSTFFDGAKDSVKTISLPAATFAKLTNTSFMFSDMEKLTSLNLSKATFAASTNSSYMFANTSSIPLIDLKVATFAASTTAWNMFNGCRGAVSILLPKATFANCTTMAAMFSNCESVTSLALSAFNTAKVEDMSYMFNNCTQVESITLGTNFKISVLKFASYMFSECIHLTTLTKTAANWTTTTDSLELAEKMFYHCICLQDLSFLKNIKTANLSNGQGMFTAVGSRSTVSPVQMDLTNWDLTKLGLSNTNLSEWFYDDSPLPVPEQPTYNEIPYGSYTVSKTGFENIPYKATLTSVDDFSFEKWYKDNKLITTLPDNYLFEGKYQRRDFSGGTPMASMFSIVYESHLDVGDVNLPDINMIFEDAITDKYSGELYNLKCDISNILVYVPKAGDYRFNVFGGSSVNNRFGPNFYVLDNSKVSTAYFGGSMTISFSVIDKVTNLPVNNKYMFMYITDLDAHDTKWDRFDEGIEPLSGVVSEIYVTSNTKVRYDSLNPTWFVCAEYTRGSTGEDKPVDSISYVAKCSNMSFNWAGTSCGTWIRPQEPPQLKPDGFSPLAVNMTNVVMGKNSDLLFKGAAANGCLGVESFTGLDTVNSSVLESLDFMFYNCSLAGCDVDITTWDMGNVKHSDTPFGNNGVNMYVNISNQTFPLLTKADRIFAEFSRGRLLDATGADLSSAVTMRQLCYKSDLDYIELKNLITSNATTNMSGMFEQASNYYNRVALHFNYSNVTNLSNYLKDLKSIKNENNEVTLYFCGDLSHVTNIVGLIQNSPTWFADITALSDSPVSDLDYAFNGCASLETIYTGGEIIDWSNASGTGTMANKFIFTNSPNLVGGNGTTYVLNPGETVDKRYARCDLVAGNAGITQDQPGLFSPALTLNNCVV